jgi:hypothetical protein
MSKEYDGLTIFHLLLEKNRKKHSDSKKHITFFFGTKKHITFKTQNKRTNSTLHIQIKIN